MFKKFKCFINENLKRIFFPLEEGIDFGIKNITNDIIIKFEELKKNMNMPLWNIKNKSILGYFEGIDKKGVVELKQNLELENGPKVPKGYIDFLQNFNGMNILMSFVIYGHLDKGISIYFNRLKSFPKYIKQDCLNIGSYNPDDSPIFINQEGNILVFSGKYIFDKNHPGEEDEAEEALIAYWDNIEDFITEETERYYKLFLEKPFAFPTAEMLPHNITAEKFNKLVNEGKIIYK